MKNVVKAAVAVTIAAVSVASTASAHHNSTPKYASGFVTQAYKDSHPWQYQTDAFGRSLAVVDNTVTIINRGAYALTVRPVDYSSTHDAEGVSVGQAVTFEEDVVVQVQCADYGETRFNAHTASGNHVRITYWGSCFDATTGNDVTRSEPTQSGGGEAPRGLRYWAP